MAETLVPERVKKRDVRFVSSTELPDTAGMAMKLFTEAIAFCARKTGAGNSADVTDLLRQNDRTTHAYCLYGLAKRVAESLAAMDDNVKSVYIYDYDATPEDICLGSSSHSVELVHLIVWTNRKTAALVSLVAGLDRALTQIYADLLDKPQLVTLLDVQMVDDDDVDSCTGYGALLGSIHHRPMQIWAR